MKLTAFIILSFLISCSSETDRVLEYENEVLERKDITEFIKKADVSFDDFLNTNAKNIMSEYLTLKKNIKDDLDVEKLYDIQNILTQKTHILLNLFDDIYANDSNLEDYYEKQSKAYLVKHLHLSIDTLVKKLNRYDIDQTFVDNLINDVEEKPELMDSYIKKYGVVAHINKSLALEYKTFGKPARDEIFDGKDFKIKTFNSSFGSHIIEKISTIKNKSFDFDSYERFKFYSDSVNFKNFRNEFKLYLRDYFLQKRTTYNYKIHTENIVQTFSDLNGLTEKDINEFKYKNRIIASFSIDGVFYNILMQDLHYSFIENFYAKLSAIQQKPETLNQYIENLTDAIILSKEKENKKYLKDYSKISTILVFINKSKLYFQKSLRKKEISDEEIKKEYMANTDLYVKPKSRLTYGFSVSASDSAKLSKDLKKITHKNIKNYYIKYSPYLNNTKNIKMRFLGDLQANSYGTISKEVFKLKQNAISKIIKHNNLFYIFYYTKEIQEEIIPYEQAKYKIKQTLIKRIEKNAMERFVKDFEETKNRIIIH